MARTSGRAEVTADDRAGTLNSSDVVYVDRVRLGGASSKQLLAPLFAGLFLSYRLLGLQHVGLAAISLGHIHKTLGDFRV